MQVEVKVQLQENALNNFHINFCCIFHLFIEATAIFIAWTGILSQSFSLFIQLPNLIFVMFFATFHDDNGIGRFLTVVLFLSMIAISCFILWLCKTLLDGVQTRNYRLMKPYLIINGAGVILGVIFLMCFNLYFILIVYGSLSNIRWIIY